MNAGDLPGGLELCRIAGWNQVKGDWLTFLQANPNGCFVAADGVRVYGTVTSIRYDDRFAWVGMVLVHPENRRQGIGSTLLNKAIESLRDLSCIKLDATPAGREVYLQEGFRDEYTLSRMICERPVPIEKERSIHSMSKSDFDNVLEIDKKVFGADRSGVLRHFYHSRPDLAFISSDLQGYCFGRQGYLYNHIGPIVANNPDTAKFLFASAIQHCKEKPVITDVSHFSAEWNTWLNTLGFVEQRRFIRMYKGENSFPGIPEKQFSIGGPEFG